MLRDDQIDSLTRELEQEQEDYEVLVLFLIATHVGEIKTLNPTGLTDPRVIKLKQKGFKKLKSLSKANLKKQIRNAKRTVEKVGEYAFKETVDYYSDIYKEIQADTELPKPTEKDIDLPKKDEQVQEIMRNASKKAVEIVRTDVRPQAFMLRDENGKLVPTSLSKTYSDVIDKAVSTRLQSNVSFDTVMSKTMKELQASGIRRAYYTSENGKVTSQRLDTAVRRNTLDAVRKVHQDIQFAIGEQMGADGVELSVHRFPAPDHAPVQGHLFEIEQFNNMQTAKDFKDVFGNSYTAFNRPIGALNCRHFVYCRILEETIPLFSQKQLDDILSENEKGFTMSNGKHLTMYECTQYKRRLECKIRYAKEGEMMARASKNKPLEDFYSATIANLYKQYKTFCKQCDLPPEYERTKIYL